MRFFQNDMLTDLKKLELQINNKVSNINQTLAKKTNEYDSKFIKISENISGLISQLATRKYDNERVEELLSIQNKFSEQIIENQNRISIIDKHLEDSIFRYDKIILDNLQLPGIIGNSCKFQNCRMFFENIYNELKINQKYKEKEQAIIKAFQEKVDTRIFKIENELNKIHQNINKICETKFEKFFIKMEQRLQITEGMINNCRIENSKYAQDLIKTSTSLQIQWDKLENIKNEIYEKYYEELDTFKKLVDSTTRKYYNQENEFKILKQRFSQLAEYLKDVRNQNKNYREMVKNIDFSKRQSLIKDYDNANYDKIGQDVKSYIKSPSPIRNREKYDLNENKEKNKHLYSSVTNPKTDKNLRNIMPYKIRKDSMFMKEKKNNNNIENKNLRRSVVLPQKRMTNNDLKPYILNNNKMRLSTMTINKNDNKKQKLLNQMGLKTEQKNEPGKKRFLKIFKKKKTIVTENNIDLNFGSKRNIDKIKEQNSSNEENEDDEEIISLESESSNFSMSSVISLHNIEKPEDKNESIKKSETIKRTETNKRNENVKNKEKINEKEKSNNKDNNKDIKQKSISRDKILTPRNIKKTESKEKLIKSEKKRDKDTEIIVKKASIFSKFTNKEKRNNKENLNNNEKINNYEILNKNEKIISKEKYSTKDSNKESEKLEKKIINLKENLMDNKFYKTVNNPKINNKNKNLDLNNNTKNNIYSNSNNTNDKNNTDSKINETPKKINENEYKNNLINNIQNIRINLHKNKDIQNNILTNKNDKNNILNDNSNQYSLIEEKSKNSMQINDDIQNYNQKKGFKKFESVNLLGQKKRFQLTEYNNNNKNSIKIDSEMTFPKIKTISNKIPIKDSNKLITDYNLKKQNNNDNYLLTTQNEVGKNISEYFKKNQIKFNNIYFKSKKSNSKEEKQRDIKTNNFNNNKNEDKESQKSNNLINSIDNTKNEIKKINSNAIDNINNNNAFLTSLNNINNNYNYYYNNNNLNDNNNIINILSKKNQDSDKKIDKFNNKIDFINGNIKSVNHRMNVLEDRYQEILNQLNNIYKVVSSYYHYKKRSHRTIVKEKTIRHKKEDIHKNQKFMNKINDIIYNDDENNLNMPYNEAKRILKKIEPFLIKKFKNSESK